MSTSRKAPSSAQQPVKVLVVAHDAGLGGAQFSLLEVLERLDPTRFQPVVAIPSAGPFTEALRKRGIRCYRGLAQRWIFFDKPKTTPLARRPWQLLRHPFLWAAVSWLTMPLRVLVLAMISKANGIGLVYSNTITVMDGALLARLLRIPHVWHLRESVAGNADLRFPCSTPWLPAFIVNNSARVIANSHHLRSEIFGETHDGKIRVVWNGIDLDDDHVRSATPPHIPAPPDARLTAICGRLSRRKRVDVYLKAMQHLLRTHPQLHHLVIGEGPADLTGALRKEAQRLGLGGRVHFLGHRDDVPELLRTVDVLVSASAREPFGRTLIEAMACGTPVVATRSGGPEEIIADGETGFLVDVDDDRAIAERVSALLDDASLHASIGAAGRARARTCFSLDTTVAEVEATFDEALDKA
jgi:glycosyltransferase involved in cell wall biosynthesis